jgi:hypothetical protein
MRSLLAALAVLGLAVTVAVSASADTAPIEDSPDLPWTDPTHETALELLLSRISANIAQQAVTVRCEGETDWRKLVAERGGDPNAELGYVGVDFNRRTGQLRWLADFAELAGDTICLPLKRFAVARTKPTKCVVTRLKRTTVYVRKRVAGVTKRVPKVVFSKVKGPPERCYLGKRRIVREMPESYWEAYADYAIAILTVAHEAIHLGGTVGGRLGNGVAAGDVEGEAKATCYGMQWMSYVAQELGAAADDAQAIAWFYWDNLYPGFRTSGYSAYWSADCRAGGRLDIRPAGRTAWP